MGMYVKQIGILKFHYGYTSDKGLYYKIEDTFRNMMIEQMSESGGMTPVIMGEKMKKFGIDEKMIRKVLMKQPI